jgi:hypothetical protein
MDSRMKVIKEHVYYCLQNYVLDTGLLLGSSPVVATGVQ